ncbi:MAG: class I SAM-dependent methyltransferase [Cyanobacteria bacterium P01_C01_bin.120]
MARALKVGLRWGLMVCCCWGLWACQSTSLMEGDRAYRYQQPSQDGIGKIYMGREIAQVMGHQGAYWLERPSRELQEHPQMVIDRLGLDTDAVVADIGAGTGYMTQRLARATPDGKVLAIDIQPEMIELLQQRLQELSLTNVESVLGTEDDPHLPAESLDLALMVDAYHEFAYPHEVMEHLCEALKPGGQVVLAEYRAENPLVMIKRLHKMSEAQVKREMAAVGLKWLKTDESLPQQHLLFFEKPISSALQPA